MAAAYAAIPNSTTPDDDTKDGSSQASTPATTSPMAFLSLGEPIFTPLSMDSELFSDEDDDVKPNRWTAALGSATRNNLPEARMASQLRLGEGGAGATVAEAPSHFSYAFLASQQEFDTISPPSRGKNVSVADGGETFGQVEDSDDDDADRNGEDAEGVSIKISGLISPSTNATTHPHQPCTTTPFPSEAPLHPARGRRDTAQHPVKSSSSTCASPSLTPAISEPAAPASTSSFPPKNTSDINRNISTSSSSSLISQLRESLHQQQLVQHQQQGTNTTILYRPSPILRTTSDNSAFTVRHPVPDLNTRSGAYVGNIAALEKTAERLSMTSSIEDAIRDLHGELKRSDSRRSSILAASYSASSSADEGAHNYVPQQPLTRHLSAAGSILEVNNAARLGGYSPSGYIMSPSHSLTGRLRSGSKTSNGRSELDVDMLMSRQGPGKGSTRSVRSSKLSLAEIAESEPVALTQDVLDEADRSPPAEEDDDTIRQPLRQLELDFDEPNGGAFHDMYDDGQVQRTASDLRYGEQDMDLTPMQEEERRATRESTNAYDQDHHNAFGDFDGVHCEPEDDFTEMPEQQFPGPQPQPRMSMPIRPSMPRPTSYFDPELGQQMLYYPARVPMMLNLPQKLSKKPKAAARNARQSRVLDAMGQGPIRKSDSWLPDPLEGHSQSPFSPLSSGEQSSEAIPSLRGSFRESQIPAAHSASLLPEVQLDTMPEPPPPVRQRSPRYVEPDTRKSKLSTLDNLPPQLRASAYFDLPSTSPQIEVKGGSAMATLDSILDASALAPVSAFTDHAYAGKLGSEVYGREKKNRKSSALVLQRPTSSSGEQKKRGSLFPFAKQNNDETEDRRNTIAGGSALGVTGDPNEESQGRPGSIDGGAALAPDEDEFGDSDEEAEEGYNGPPTTLLAELQLRKQQQKHRTRPINKAYPNGMHSTLLELDAVAEAQRKNRKGKRINLAWEDPAANGEEFESDDEDVPLGMLYAAKAAGNNDISAVVAEANRPLGLMERRDLEDNEPLSSRRARLQGHEPLTVAKTRSMLNLNGPTMSNYRLSQMPAGEPSPRGEPEVEEVEDETLGQRMQRLRAKEDGDNPLPRTRPVSMAFSAELLSQFGDLDDEKETKAEKSRGKENAPPQEEEETLGQRRRRLQAERDAREQEMGLGGLPRRRLSMADVLSAHPVRETLAYEAERRRQEEQKKFGQQEQKMAYMRGQMPTSLTSPNITRAGGFRGGAYNDGTGGVTLNGLPGPGMPAPGYGAAMGPGGWNNRASTAFTGYGAPPQSVYGGGLVGAPSMHGMVNPLSPPMAGFGGYGRGMNGYGAPSPMGMPMQMPQMAMGMQMQPGMPMQMQTPPAQMDRVERWRQSIMP